MENEFDLKNGPNTKTERKAYSSKRQAKSPLHWDFPGLVLALRLGLVLGNSVF